MKHIKCLSSITSKFAGFLLPTWSIKNKTAENTPQNPLTCLLFPDILPSPVQYLMRKRICIRKLSVILTSGSKVPKVDNLPSP